jgi:hypothetical protein
MAAEESPPGSPAPLSLSSSSKPVGFDEFYDLFVTNVGDDPEMAPWTVIVRAIMDYALPYLTPGVAALVPLIDKILARMVKTFGMKQRARIEEAKKVFRLGPTAEDSELENFDFMGYDCQTWWFLLGWLPRDEDDTWYKMVERVRMGRVEVDGDIDDYYREWALRLFAMVNIRMREYGQIVDAYAEDQDDRFFANLKKEFKRAPEDVYDYMMGVLVPYTNNYVRLDLPADRILLPEKDDALALWRLTRSLGAINEIDTQIPIIWPNGPGPAPME